LLDFFVVSIFLYTFAFVSKFDAKIRTFLELSRKKFYFFEKNL